MLTIIVNIRYINYNNFYIIKLNYVRRLKYVT